MKEGLRDFFKAEIGSCEHCGDEDIYIMDIRFVDEPSGFLATVGQVFAENHPGIHVRYKCRECNREFDRNLDPNYTLLSLETWVGQERARRLIKALTGL